MRLPTLLMVFASLVASGCAGSRMASELSSTGFEWVQIQGGPFMMGDTFENENEDALPVHQVFVADFEMSKYETTFDQYDWFARATGRPLPMPEMTDRGSRAVGGVRWEDARAFCEFIGGRLPTEIEWEYAAAGGSAKQLFPGTNDEDDLDRFVRHRANSLAEPFYVGRKQPNLFGLHEMGGNVAEWVAGYYERYPETGETPIWQDLDQFDMRIARGGSFASEPYVARTYWRAGTLKYITTDAIGVRCVRD